MPDFVDISNWQAGMDLNLVKSAGAKGVLAKASQGSGFADPTHDGFRVQAASLGLIFGNTHYGEPSKGPVSGDARSVVVDARGEAEWFLKAANPQAGELVALDLEDSTPLSSAEMMLWVATFLDHVEEALTQKPLIYTNAGYWNQYLGGSQEFGAYPLWLASWGTNDGTFQKANPLPGWSQVALQQFTNKGAVPGWSGSLDFDWLNPAVDIATLQIGQQPTTLGVPYGGPYTLKFSDAVLASSPTRVQAFTDQVYTELNNRGQVTLVATRLTA